MKIMRAFQPLVVIAALSAGACAQPPAANAPEDLAAVNSLRTAFETAMNTGDAAAFANLYAPDGISAQNHEKTITGRDAIVAAQKAAFAQVTFKMAIKAEETWTKGDAGFDRGTFTMTITPKSGGEPMTQEGRYIVLLHKDAEGKWRVSRDIDNSSQPMPMPAPPAADSKK